MANVWDMNQSDYNKYLQNKKAWETGSGPDTAMASMENSALREKYGISGDNYSYNDLVRQQAYMPNQYTNAADKSISGLANFSRYNEPYGLAAAKRELQNFRYSPETDPDFQAYKDMYARQSQAAQGQTLANLTALSGGRNNSWASAATAQVGQAYAQKTADMVPQLAQAAYNRLLQRYGIESQEADRAYGRWQDAYARERDLSGLYQQRDLTERELLRQRAQDSIAYRDADLQYGAAAYAYELDRMYAGQERQAGLDAQELQNRLYGKQYDWYDDNARAALEGQQWQNKIYGKQHDWFDEEKAAQIAATNRSGTSSGGSSRTTAEKPMTKTEADYLVNFTYTDKDGYFDGMAFIDDVFYKGVYGTDEDAQAVIKASGLTAAEINELLREKDIRDSYAPGLVARYEERLFK
ncbi:MAG: hypothetical protein M0R40_10160 [Firmicutes bacterium]|nr:hypothetical protein [Bacillota bacterium]